MLIVVMLLVAVVRHGCGFVAVAVVVIIIVRVGVLCAVVICLILVEAYTFAMSAIVTIVAFKGRNRCENS